MLLVRASDEVLRRIYLVEVTSMIKHYCKKAVCSCRHSMIRTTNSNKFCKSLHNHVQIRMMETERSTSSRILHIWMQ
uniref:Uncharacterized protein n=1 Tax=Zea mays TaxID=4577 RepID=C0PNC4_MAIZE|nr:unknown [Zea mays]